MKSRRGLLVWLAVIIIGVGVLGTRVLPRRSAIHAATPAAEPKVRRPAVAGMFYPADADELRAQVERYLREAEEPPQPGQLVALVVPHAGYVFSGPVAGYAYRQLSGRHYDTVVVVAPSHRVPCRGFALSEADQWQTPLGAVEIDRAAGEALKEAGAQVVFSEAAHGSEHSIEVQLPFLQVALREFRLLPILMTDFSRSSCAALAEALTKWARGRSALLIASTDMSHYPAYEEAVRADRETLEAIETGDADEVEKTTRRVLSRRVDNLSTCLCGEGPVKTVLMAAQALGGDNVQVLRYANSGDIPGAPREGVVGYCAVALYGGSEAAEQAQPPQEDALTPAQQQRLLALARTTVEQYARTGRAAQVEETDPALIRPGAAFVTLTKEGQLRGCIGALLPTGPLAQSVRDNAIAAASRDYRFPPVRAAELPYLEIEISVLSPLRKVASADEIELGKHGVLVEMGPRRGVFLPQVAEQTGWSREEFLSHLCRDKAGLDADAWKRGATLYVFTVQSFSSPSPRGQSHAEE